MNAVKYFLEQAKYMHASYFVCFIKVLHVEKRNKCPDYF